jgi:hypothetical protein
MEKLALYMRGWRGYFGFCRLRRNLWNGSSNESGRSRRPRHQAHAVARPQERKFLGFSFTAVGGGVIADVNRGLSYESDGANRNVPVNWATTAQRDAAAGPAGTTNYSNESAGLPGGTANLLAGTDRTAISSMQC